jgi:predicted phage terminase large subunit-like protein
VSIAMSKPAKTRVERLRTAADAARTDVNRFASLCFADSEGEPLRQAAVHRALQAFLDAHRRALVALPRDHGKSVQIGIRLVWELGRQPGLRIKIVCATEALAAERGRFIRDSIAHNPLVRTVFPHLKSSRPWEVVRFAVARPATIIGPSVAAIGVNVRSTGARADLLVCDDIVDVTALRSLADRQRVKQHFRENLVNLLEPDGRLWYVHTPWHRDDLSADLVRSGAYPAFRRSVGPDLEPVWPEHWPRERLIERRAEIGTTAFSRAYRLVCATDEETALRPEWFRTWHEPAPIERTILAVDPAASTALRADRTAIVVLSQTADGVVRCLESTARRVSGPEMMRWLSDADSFWRPEAILFESQGPFLALKDVLVAHCAFGAKVHAVKQSRDKAERIRAFGVHVENGRFLLKGDAAGHIDPAQTSLYDELTTFPLADSDDQADACAFGTAWMLSTREPRVF